jgi:hypothetical protein
MNSKDKTRHIHFPHSTVDSDNNYTKLVTASRRLNVVDRRLVMHSCFQPTYENVQFRVPVSVKINQNTV